LRYSIRLKKGLNNAISIWKFSFSKIYIVLNYRILTSRRYIILVGVGDFIKPLLSIKATIKYVWIYFVCGCIGFFAFIIA